MATSTNLLLKTPQALQRVVAVAAPQHEAPMDHNVAALGSAINGRESRAPMLTVRDGCGCVRVGERCFQGGSGWRWRERKATTRRPPSFTSTPRCRHAAASAVIPPGIAEANPIAEAEGAGRVEMGVQLRLSNKILYNPRPFSQHHATWPRCGQRPRCQFQFHYSIGNLC